MLADSESLKSPFHNNKAHTHTHTLKTHRRPNRVCVEYVGHQTWLCLWIWVRIHHTSLLIPRSPPLPRGMQETDYYTPLAHIPPLPRVFLSFFLTRFTSQHALFPVVVVVVSLPSARQSLSFFEGIQVLGVIRVSPATSWRLYTLRVRSCTGSSFSTLFWQTCDSRFKKNNNKWCVLPASRRGRKCVTEQVHLGAIGLIIQIKLHIKKHTHTHTRPHTQTNTDTFSVATLCDEDRKSCLHPSVIGRWSP